MRNSEDFSQFIRKNRDEDIGKLNSVQKLEIFTEIAEDHIPKIYLKYNQAQMLTLIGKTQRYISHSISSMTRIHSNLQKLLLRKIEEQ